MIGARLKNVSFFTRTTMMVSLKPSLNELDLPFLRSSRVPIRISRFYDVHRSSFKHTPHVLGPALQTHTYKWVLYTRRSRVWSSRRTSSTPRPPVHRHVYFLFFPLCHRAWPAAVPRSILSKLADQNPTLSAPQLRRAMSIITVIQSRLRCNYGQKVSVGALFVPTPKCAVTVLRHPQLEESRHPFLLPRMKTITAFENAQVVEYNVPCRVRVDVLLYFTRRVETYRLWSLRTRWVASAPWYPWTWAGTARRGPSRSWSELSASAAITGSLTNIEKRLYLVVHAWTAVRVYRHHQPGQKTVTTACAATTEAARSKKVDMAWVCGSSNHWDQPF